MPFNPPSVKPFLAAHTFLAWHEKSTVRRHFRARCGQPGSAQPTRDFCGSLRPDQCRSIKDSRVSWVWCPVAETSRRGGRPRAPRCGRPAAQALAFRQRGAPTAREALFECTSALDVGSWRYRFERELQRETSDAVRRGDVVCGVKRQVVLGPQLRGSWSDPCRCDPAACAYAFVESALVCRQVLTAEGCVANSTKASAVQTDSWVTVWTDDIGNTETAISKRPATTIKTASAPR